MKFISNNQKEISVDGGFNVLDYRVFPFHDRNDIENELKEIVINDVSYSQDNIFILKISANKIGTFKFFFDKGKFENKEELFNNIKSLKEIEVVDKESAINKISQVLDFVKTDALLLFSYLGNGEFKLNKDELKSLCGDVVTFYLEEVTLNTKKEEKKISIKFLFENLLFVVLSAILVGLTNSLGLYNIFAGNSSAVIFYVCSLVGVGLSSYVYFDLFKTNNIKSKMSLISVLSSFVSCFIGIGLFYLFRLSFKEIIANEPAFYLYTLTTFALLILSIIIGYVLFKFIKKKK